MRIRNESNRRRTKNSGREQDASGKVGKDIEVIILDSDYRDKTREFKAGHFDGWFAK
jgi:hypothetical protein